MNLRTLLEQFAQDVGYAVRTMAAKPLFASMAVLSRQAGYRDQALVQFYENLRNRLRTVPGVRNVTSSSYSLVSGSMSATGVEVPGFHGAADANSPIMSVGASFFATMQIPILLGRDIEEHDENRQRSRGGDQ